LEPQRELASARPDGEERMLYKSIFDFGYLRRAGATRTVTTSYDTNLLGWALGQSVSAGSESVSVKNQYDQLGRIVASWDGNDSPDTGSPPSSMTQYGARGKVAAQVARDGSETTFSYNGYDELVMVVDPRGNDRA